MRWIIHLALSDQRPTHHFLPVLVRTSGIGLLLSSWMYSSLISELFQFQGQWKPIGLSPARQCCGVGLSAGQPCLGLTSSVQSCLPCVHVRERLSKGRLNRIAVLVRCKDGKPETVGSAFKITASVSDAHASAAPLCEGSASALFCLRKCCFMLRVDVRWMI